MDDFEKISEKIRKSRNKEELDKTSPIKYRDDLNSNIQKEWDAWIPKKEQIYVPELKKTIKAKDSSKLKGLFKAARIDNEILARQFGRRFRFLESQERALISATTLDAFEGMSVKSASKNLFVNERTLREHVEKSDRFFIENEKIKKREVPSYIG